MRSAFGAALLKAGERHGDLFVLDADCATSTQTILFAERFPERFANVGIAEQNMVGVAAGLAQVGYRVVINSFAAMLTHRAHEQLMQSIGLMASRVLVVGHYAGLSAGEEGAPHHAISDVAIMRAIPGMEVWWPGNDISVTELVLKFADDLPGPTYLRLERNPVPPPSNQGVRIGPVEIWGEAGSSRVCVVASGSVAGRCIQAAAGAEGVIVVCVDRVKPFPSAELRPALAGCPTVVCAEEHGTVGGLTSALRESDLLGSRALIQVAIPGFTETGSQQALTEKYGLDVLGLSKTLEQAIGLGS
jgi:transketolase